MTVDIEKEKDKFILETILKEIGSSEFILVINGIPQKHGNSYVYVKNNQDPQKPGVSFRIKFRTSQKTFSEDSSSIRELMLREIKSAKLFSWDFSDWLKQFEKETNRFHIKISVNNNLKLLFVETAMYNLFRTTIPTKENLNVNFIPQVNGKSLSQFELITLLNQFRINGFLSLLEFDRLRTPKRRVTNRVPEFYKMSNRNFMAMIREPNIFNPFFEDMMIWNQVKDRKIFKLLVDKSISHEHLKTTVSYLNVFQASEALGLSRLVPFNYQIFISLLAGLVMDPNFLPISFPSKNKEVMRLHYFTEDFPPIITMEEFERSGEFKRSHYVKSNTLATFLMQNVTFYQSNGFRDFESLLTTMEDIALV